MIDPSKDWPAFKAAVVAAVRVGGYGVMNAVWMLAAGRECTVCVGGQQFAVTPEQWIELDTTLRALR